MRTIHRRRRLLAAASCAALLAGCGGAGSTSPVDAPVPDPRSSATPPAREVAPASSTDPTPALPPPAPRPAAPRIGARGAPSVEACIERRIHDQAYEGLNPRDPRRRLRRLELKAECEEQLAAR